MKNGVILLVEDDELDVISIKRTVSKLGIEHTLHVAYNGKEALALLGQTSPEIKPDVILLDLNMPKMNGVEFLKAIRKDSRLEKTPVFIMTTSGSAEDRDRTEKLGISGYIIKPLSYTSNMKKTDSMDAFVQFHLRKILSEA
jgi:CheY-like chemotaxis protein